MHNSPVFWSSRFFFVVALFAIPTCVHVHRECLIGVGFVEGQDATSQRLGLTQDSLLNHEPLLLDVILS